MLKKILLEAKEYQELKMNKFFNKTAKCLVILILILAVFLLVEPALAATLDVGLEYATATGLGTQDIRVTIASIIRVALGLLGIIAVVIILYGGFIYMTSEGNPEKVEKAKKILRNAVIGLLIILMAFAIASFIIMALLRATGALPAPPPYGSGGGALGNGIIESHYPPRNAFDIPRNTSIVVTFKVAMDVNTLVRDNEVDNLSDFLINSDNVIIRRTADTSGAKETAVRAFFTEDLKTFVFKPIYLLGSSIEPTNYTVELKDGIKKFGGGDAFGKFGGYDWRFEVSTKVDLTPPRIESVIPRAVNDPTDTVPRNMIVQINFNEPINPMTMRGLVELEGGSDITVGSLRRDDSNIINTYNNINVCAEFDCSEDSDKIIAGEFLYSNQYKTVEFVTNDLCGKNTCGGDVFCLPGDSTISVLVKAAELFLADRSCQGGDKNGDPCSLDPDCPGGKCFITPTAKFPYTGIVDMCDNSLDGNRDREGKGPVDPPFHINFINDPTYDKNLYGDDTFWSFFTNDRIELEPPEIIAYYPASGDEIIPLHNFEIVFDRIIMAYTLKPDSGYGDGYCGCVDVNNCPGYSCDTARGYCLKDENRYVCTNSEPVVLCPSNVANDCTEQEHITFVQPPGNVLQDLGYPGAWGYHIRSDNDFISDPAGRTIAYVIPVKPYGENLTFGVRVGSGIKDILQNCYQPCAGLECEKKEIGPGEYEVEPGKWQPSDASFPTCDIPLPTE